MSILTLLGIPFAIYITVAIYQWLRWAHFGETLWSALAWPTDLIKKRALLSRNKS